MSCATVYMVTAAALTDKTGYAYGPYGETVASGTEIAQPFQYTGREWDGETGLYYYRARYYAPEMGRFISEDPIGFAGGINFYAYVGNDPVNFVDPLGLFEVTMRCKSQGLAGQSASLWSP